MISKKEFALQLINETIADNDYTLEHAFLVKTVDNLS